MPKWIQVGDVSFGSKDGPTTTRITVTLPTPLADELAREAFDRRKGASVSGIVREAVTEYFAHRQDEGLPGFVGMIDAPDIDPTTSERVEEIIAEDFSHGDPDRG